MTDAVIGHSRAGRALIATTVSGTVGGTGALLFGAIHGDEPEAATLCERMRLALLERPAERATTLVCVANPDGLSAGRKNNDADVDLNRNFPAQNWQAAHAPGYFPGAAPASEPETRALMALIERLQPAVLVAVHQPFGCLNWDGQGEALARAMAARCGYPALASVGYPTPGSFGSLYGVDGGLAVITFELPRPMPPGDWEGCIAALYLAANFETGR